MNDKRTNFMKEFGELLSRYRAEMTVSCAQADYGGVVSMHLDITDSDYVQLYEDDIKSINLYIDAETVLTQYKKETSAANSSETPKA